MNITKEILQDLAIELQREFNAKHSVPIFAHALCQSECIRVINGLSLIDGVEEIFAWAAKYHSSCYICAYENRVEIKIFPEWVP